MAHVNETLLQAVRSGDEVATRAILKLNSQIDINATYGYQGTTTATTLLHEAGNAAVARLLLTSPPPPHTPFDDVNRTDAWGNTPLWMACSTGKEDVVRELLGVVGVDPNKSHAFAGAPLWCASYKGKAAIVKLLLGHPYTDVNILGSSNESPLAVALSRGHLEVASMIVAHGGRVNKEATAEVDKAMGGHDKYMEWVKSVLYPQVEKGKENVGTEKLDKVGTTATLETEKMAAAVVMVVDDTSSPAGEIYTGRLVNGQRDGKGMCKCKNGDTYDGEWRDGLQHGRGVYKWADGESYEGEWFSGKYDGWGVHRYPDGLWFEGLYRDNHWKRGTWHDGVDIMDGSCEWNATENVHEMQGWGVQRRAISNHPESAPASPTGIIMETVYEGEWNRDLWHGQGTWNSPDGSGDIYHGQFYHEKKSGTGRMLFGDGGSYVGEWKDDLFHGRGVRLWGNGDRYDGQWVGGKEHGEGTKMWSRDGSSFTGLWESGLPTKGMRRWPNGDIFEGTFTCDGSTGWECRGEGVATLSSSTVVEGTINNTLFQSGSSEVTHRMGSSLPQFEHHKQIENLKKEQGEVEKKLNEEILAVKIEAETKHDEEIKVSKRGWELRIKQLEEEVHTSSIPLKAEVAHWKEKYLNLQTRFSSLSYEIQKEKKQIEQMISLIPADVSDFSLENLLGTGASAAAFKVQFSNGLSSSGGTNKVSSMVLKVLFNWENTPRHTKLRQKYMAECVILCSIPPHPNVIHPLGALVIPRLPYEFIEQIPKSQPAFREMALSKSLAFVMPFGGVSLASFLQFLLSSRPSNQWEVTVNLFQQALAAVNHIETNKIVHRDIKEDNILVDPATNTLSLIDFGEATRCLKADLVVTVSSDMQVWGNVGTMPPELSVLLRTLRATGPSPFSYSKCDSFAVAITFWDSLLPPRHKFIGSTLNTNMAVFTPAKLVAMFPDPLEFFPSIPSTTSKKHTGTVMKEVMASMINADRHTRMSCAEAIQHLQLHSSQSP